MDIGILSKNMIPIKITCHDFDACIHSRETMTTHKVKGEVTTHEYNTTYDK